MPFPPEGIEVYIKFPAHFGSEYSYMLVMSTPGLTALVASKREAQLLLLIPHSQLGTPPIYLTSLSVEGHYLTSAHVFRQNKSVTPNADIPPKGPYSVQYERF